MKPVFSIVTAFLFLLFFFDEAISQNYVQGYVYEDISQTGQRDDGDPGIAGVMVSNQLDVVLTDENGFYRLPIEEEMIIFVTKPPEYKFVLDEQYIPQFFYIHQPEGSPELNYSGLEPTGHLPESVDFGLISAEKREKFSAVIFGDPQPANHRELDYYRDGVVSELIGVETDMIIPLGDIMFDNLDLFGRYNEIMAVLEKPVFNIIGNHDINFDADGNRYARETFKRYYGPSHYSFEEGDVHFIALDNVDYLGYNEEGNPSYVGNIRPGQLEWIANNLEHVDENKLIVLMAHIPLYAPGRDETASLRTGDRGELFELLENFDNVLFLGGHVHTIFHSFLGEDFGRQNPNPIHQHLTAAASGSWWKGPYNKNGIPVTTQRDGTPNGYHIYTFDGNSYSDIYKPAGLDPDYQMRIEAPRAQLSINDLPDEEIRVNVFNGSERSEVAYRVNNGEWADMERLDLAISTFFEKMREEYDEKFLGWIQPIQTTHIWRADLPEGLSKGIHKLEIRSRDMFGQGFTQTKVLEIVE
ncbi:MAG: calcineurin-like phosphoesterase family protein [Balneolaceae bacterium]|nr:calcineurin-like phosphoesterase family protein [Balneolaceae bacterium]